MAEKFGVIEEDMDKDKVDKIEEIGKIKLNLNHYPGEDYYCDGDIEDELLAITRATLS